MPATTTPSGLIINDTVVGTGKAAAAGQDVKVHYTAATNSVLLQDGRSEAPHRVT